MTLICYNDLGKTENSVNGDVRSLFTIGGLRCFVAADRDTLEYY